MVTERILRLSAASVFLLTAAVPDLKTKEIPVRIPAVYLCAALIADLLFPSQMNGEELLCGAVPGAGLLALSVLSGRKVGEGDGICLAICGLLAGLSYTVFIAAAALWMAGAAGIFCICMGEGKAEDRIAFVPFLAVSAAGLLVCEIAGVLEG